MTFTISIFLFSYVSSLQFTGHQSMSFAIYSPLTDFESEGIINILFVSPPVEKKYLSWIHSTTLHRLRRVLTFNLTPNIVKRNFKLVFLYLNISAKVL